MSLLLDGEQLQVLVLVMGLTVFLYSLSALFASPHGLRRLSQEDVLQYVQKRQFPPIDVVILTPFTLSEDLKTNFSALSVARFIPWARRIHVHDPQSSDHPENHLEYWNTHQKARVVHFHQDLLDYSLTSPFLSDHFILLKPHFLVTNYVFSWQFFIDDSPVIRNCNTGLIPLTRQILNECIYRRIQPKNYYRFAIWKGIHDGVIRYEDNMDHFFPPCSSHPYTSTKQISAFQEDQIKSYFQFEEIHKQRKKPYQVVIGLVCRADDDLTFPMPEQYDNKIQIWVNFTDLKDATARLSFVHRMMVTKNVFVEIQADQFKWKPESLGAEVMKRMRTLSNAEEFEVLEIFSYGIKGPWYEPTTNLVGNKLAQAYTCPFTVFSKRKDTDESRTREWHRLQAL